MGFLVEESKEYTLKKTIPTVFALCCLHYFLIDHGSTKVDANHAQDSLSLTLHGAVPMKRAANGEPVPGQLISGGDHFDDDINYIVRRSIYQMHQGRTLPRTAMIAHVASLGMSRPIRNLERNGTI